jgi:hypothetical protein
MKARGIFSLRELFRKLSDNAQYDFQVSTMNTSVP